MNWWLAYSALWMIMAFVSLAASHTIAMYGCLIISQMWYIANELGEVLK